MRVPLHFHGAENSPAVKISKGLISHLVSFLEVRCLPKDLPEFIDVDLSNMTAQTILRASDLNLPAGVTVVEKAGEDTPIATVITDFKEEEADMAADAAAAAAAAVAAVQQSAAPVDTVAEIQKYKALLDAGVLTEEEFAAKKKQLLGI